MQKKAFDKTQHSSVKVLKILGIQGTCLNITKAVYSNPIANIKLSGEKLKAISLKQEKDKVVHPLHTWSIQYLKS